MNAIKILTLGITGGHLAFAPKSPVARYFRQLTRMCAALSLSSDITFLVLGGAFKRKEAISARLGDVLSMLYLSSSVVRYFHQQKTPNDDLPYVEWILQFTLYETQTALMDFFDNFPSKWLGSIMRRIIFPWGLSYKKPRDKLTEAIAKHMLKPSALRDRLTKLCYLGDKPTDPCRRMEIAFANALAAEPIMKKINTGIQQDVIKRNPDLLQLIQTALQHKLIDADEAALLKNNWHTTMDAIQVDDFAPEFFTH